MTLSFPLSLTWAEIAALPNAADTYGWDDSYDDTLEDTIEAYSTSMSTKLDGYLTLIGYDIISTGINLRSLSALETAHALFLRIMFEYDETDCPRIPVTRYGYDTLSTPTWALFELGGDDDVDYNGSQPSCLSELLLAQVA